MAEQEYGRFSQWRDSSSLDPAQARELAERLERRGRTEDELATRAAYLDLLGITPGERVLDVGCGSGVVTRELARRVAPDGAVVGLDPSPAFLTIARELAVAEGVAEAIEFQEGDARSLPFADAEFDVVLAVTSLTHVLDADRAIPEMARVVRPGGRVGVVDLDGDGLVIAHPDRVVTRRIAAARSDHAQVDGWFARRLPGLMAEAGLHDVRIRAFTPIDRDPGGFYAGLAERGAQIALDVGAITDDERRRWLDQLHAEQAAGRFFAGVTHLFVWGIRPLIMLVASDAEAVAVEPTTVEPASHEEDVGVSAVAPASVVPTLLPLTPVEEPATVPVAPTPVPAEPEPV